LDDARAILDAEFLPPVQLGDVWRITQEQPAAIGIIDGYFDHVPAVWHKEILYALACKIPVYGSSSMGALRGAELASFGMMPIGSIAAAYCSGEINSDDEVAMVHASSEYGYRPLSEPLVNVRSTVAAAIAQRVLSEGSGKLVIETARSLFYPDRAWEHLLRLVPFRQNELSAFRAWLPRGRIDQKRADAMALLKRMGSDLATSGGKAVLAAPEFTPTVLWSELVRQETPLASILDEFLLAVPLTPAVAEGVSRASSGQQVNWISLLSAEPDWPQRCRRARRKQQVSAQSTGPGKGDTDQLLAWFFGERLGWPDNVADFLRERGWTDVSRVIEVAAREAAFTPVN
jgi:hypothetical protein